MKEPKEYKNNVHFWLRKIFYFVHFADVNDVTVLSASDENQLTKEQGEDPEKGEAEFDLRTRLKKNSHLDPYAPDRITKEEAEEACRKLYEMFNMPLDDEVLRFLDDKRCSGGMPRA